jgi:phosphomannomutase
MQLDEIFKAYDIRGKVPEPLNAAVAYYIGQAFAKIIKPKKVVLGHDIRLSSPMLKQATAAGLAEQGVQVFDIGLCGTEEIYFATSYYAMDGGVMVTASHNPIDYNGLKLVKSHSRPISSDSELLLIKDYVIEHYQQCSEPNIHITELIPLKSRQDFVQHLLGYIDIPQLKALKIAVDPGNGGAGLVIDALEAQLPFEFIKINYQADGTFPNGIPNPLLEQQRQSIIQAVKNSQANFGIAWDGDFDRCFFVDEKGEFIEGYYLVGLLAQAFLDKPQANRQPEKIIHDPRLSWNSIDIIESAGGQAIQSKTGHAFIKDAMRKENAVYGGEMSAHHYFRDFFYCDSGMIPWLLVAEQLSQTQKTLSEFISDRKAAFPCSGEINFTVANAKACLKEILRIYQQDAIQIDYTDGIGIEYPNWRCNIRSSNTEPLLRLNVESRQDIALMQKKTQQLAEIIEKF